MNVLLNDDTKNATSLNIKSCNDKQDKNSKKKRIFQVSEEKRKEKCFSSVLIQKFGKSQKKNSYTHTNVGFSTK